MALRGNTFSDAATRRIVNTVKRVERMPQDLIGRNNREHPSSYPPIRFGKATAAWTSGNTITLTPIVSSTDTTATGEANVTVNLFPQGASGDVQIDANAVCGFILVADGTYLLVSIRPTVGSAQYQVKQMSTTTAVIWDFVRASA